MDEKNEFARLELHEKLCEFIGNRNVYFQPPAEVKLRYPAIVYRVDGKPAKRADNKNYLVSTRYHITIINLDPDTANEDSDRFLSSFPTSRWLGQGAADGLYNTTYSLTTTRRN